MGKSTEISWTDHTFNPWWGCQRVSPGCEHCYAETFAKPLLGPLDLRWCLEDFEGFTIDWVIVGGESGPRHREFDIAWARSLRDQCHAAGAAFHFKQVGGRTHAEGGCELDGREWKEFPRVRELSHA